MSSRERGSGMRSVYLGAVLGGVDMGDIGTHWGNIRFILGLYGDNGKLNGNYYLVFWHRNSGLRARATHTTNSVLST